MRISSSDILKTSRDDFVRNCVRCVYDTLGSKEEVIRMLLTFGIFDKARLLYEEIAEPSAYRTMSAIYYGQYVSSILMLCRDEKSDGNINGFLSYFKSDFDNYETLLERTFTMIEETLSEYIAKWRD